MKQSFIVIFIFVAITQACLSNAQTNKPEQQPTPQQLDSQLANRSLRFTENKGQVAELNGKLRPDILFTAYSSGVKLFITSNGIYYQFSRVFEKKKTDNLKALSKFDCTEVDSTQFYRLDMQLVGATKHPSIIKEDEGSDFENFYLSHCPNGVLGVKNYGKITVKNIYPNIDWVVYAKNGTIEYDFVVNPGGDINVIKIKYEGANSIKIDDNGNLNVSTFFGYLQEKKPYSFQTYDDKLESSFQIKDDYITFNVQYDKNEVLVIDPNIVWATYYGGNSNEFNGVCTVDATGNTYLTGATYSTTGISAGGSQNSYGGGSGDAFLVKFTASGSRTWATYYGGNSYDYGTSCAIDSNGNVCLAGMTQSTNNIASGGFQPTIGGYIDAFVVKFNSGGVRIWGTYYGGSDDDRGYSCTFDRLGNIYMAGFTYSTSGIASGGFQNSFGGGFRDAFLVKFSSTGLRLWATYFGGTGDEYESSCSIDKSNNIYLAGTTSSPTNIAFNGFQNSFGGSRDAFLVKFHPDGSGIWSTYYGGNDDDYGASCAVDKMGNVYVTGYTYSTSNIAWAGFQDVFGGTRDAFIVKFDSLSNRLWGTYYGGDGFDGAFSVITDKYNNIFFCGTTYSDSGIAFEGFQNNINGLVDGFIVKLNPDGGRQWASYCGGADGLDVLNSCGVDTLNNVYTSGQTSSISGIAYGGFQNAFGGGIFDVFFVKITDAPNCKSTAPLISATLNNFCSGISTTLNISDGNLNNAKYWQWYRDSCGKTPVGTGTSITVSPTATTTYYARGEGGCSPGNCGSITITVNPSLTPAISIISDAVICNAVTAAAYQFSYYVTGVNLENISTGATTLFGTGIDDAASSLQTLPFTFTYAGTSHNQFSISSNGVIGLGSTIIGTAYTNTNSFYNNSLMPWWDDLRTGNNGSVRYKIIGNAPNRKVVIEWNVNTTSTTAAYDRTLQAWLFETSNIIQYVYGSQAVTTGTATIAIAKTSIDYKSITAATNTASSTSRNDNNAWKPSVSYIFSPCSSASICYGTKVTFTASATNGGTTPVYQWKKNNVNVGKYNLIYVDSTLINTDSVWCELTSSLPCVTVNPAISNKLNTAVGIKPTISASGSTTNVCPGQSVILTAPAGSSYLWSTGDTTQIIVVSTAGNYKVNVTNNNCTAMSDPVIVTYQSCPKPSNPAVTNITSTSARLTWAAPVSTCVIGYQEQYRVTGTTAWTTLRQVNAQRNLTGLLPGTTYEWRVQSGCQQSPPIGSGNIAGPNFTTSLSVTAGASLKIPAVNDAFDATITPNPAKATAMLALRGAFKEVRITLTDLAGKILWESRSVKEKQVALPVSNLAAGIYLVNVYSGKEVRVIKFVKE